LSLATATGGHADDVGLVIYPLFHTGGPDCLVLPHFLLGATLVILDGGDADEILAATQRHKATNIFCVPTVWRRLLARLRQRDYDVDSVQRCLGSSDTFPPDLLDEILQRFNAEVYVTYGLTEAGCLLTVCRLTRQDRGKLGSAGRPMPIVELALVDENGDRANLGEVGQVVARTPGVMEGYWNMPERTAEALQDGWLYSGDMGRMDEQGYLYLAGRAKDMIISGGENIYPLEIERLLKEDPRIREVAVVGVPDREWGESVLAVVVPAPGAQLKEEEIVDYVRQRVAGYKKPRYVELVDALPVTTATGKVQKAVLRERYAEKYGTVRTS
jgi:fatty-acyl-CoA synthase